MYKKKVLQDLGLNPYTAPTVHKEVLTPTPQKWGTQAQEGRWIKIEKSIGGRGVCGARACDLSNNPLQRDFAPGLFRMYS